MRSSFTSSLLVASLVSTAFAASSLCGVKLLHDLSSVAAQAEQANSVAQGADNSNNNAAENFADAMQNMAPGVSSDADDVIAELTTLSNDLSATYSDIKAGSCQDLDDEDQREVCDGFVDYATEQKSLLRTLKLLSEELADGDITSLLGDMQSTTDDIADSIVDIAPACCDRVADVAGAVDREFASTLYAYTRQDRGE